MLRRLSPLALLLSLSPARADEWRPYAFTVDGDTLRPKRAALESGLAYNGLTGQGGALQPEDARRLDTWVAAAFGVTERLELGGSFQFGEDPTRGFGFSQARLDARLRLFGPTARVPLAVSIGAGYQADVLVEHAVTALVAASAEFGRVGLAFNLRAAHYFHAGRDPLDVYVTAGALVRATGWLRAGVEYVGEELEGDDEDVGRGGRHYLGPLAALRFGRVRINATSGLLIQRGQLGPLARASLAYLF